ncbi:MAG: hypothetical protein KAT77_03605 [Nanoarchaeota archaeon]|nr:hypothetical protein [Nanoarchaeota archaeon]
MAFENVIIALIPLFIILAVFEAIMKGIAMWKCGRQNQIVWYIVIFIFNTAGILPLIYLLFFQSKKKKH